MVDNVIISDRVALGFRGGPTFSTEKMEMVNGRIVRRQNRSVAVHRYVWSYQNQSDTIIDELRALFYGRRGDFKSFLLKDFADFSATAEPIGVGDGSENQFQLKKTYTDGFNPYERTIQYIKSGTLNVYLDGVLIDNSGSPSEWHVSDTGLVTLETPPGVGVVVSADFEFYVPVNFEGDEFFVQVDYVSSIPVKTVSSLVAVEVVP